MKNVMNRRFVREIKDDMGKYIALFLFLCLTVAIVSGFLVADNSIKKAYDESFDKYNVEDGHFVTTENKTDEIEKKLDAEDVKVYEMFYKDIALEDEDVIRVYQARDEVNKACIMEGEEPTADNEIGIDRLYAENNEISIGDSIELSGKKYIVTAFVALSDYSALFKNNSDMMFDAKDFSVAVTTKKGYENIKCNNEKYCYSWINKDENLSDKEADEKGEDILKAVISVAQISDFVTRADNQAIMFTGNDMGSDKVMMIVLLYVVMVVLAFVFAITTKSTIEQESGVIGTLRASGYTKEEMIRHYMMLPAILTLIAAAIGNIIGYTFVKNLIANLYYHSYSLTNYRTLWNGEAFLQTTVVPVIIVLLVSFVSLYKMLGLSVLKFLRHDLGHKTKTKAMKLPDWKFITRFRVRIIFQNFSVYITLFIGIMMASVLLIFGLIMSPVLDNYKEEVINNKIADYQYILKAPVQTSENDAEKYCVTSLNMKESNEKITVYGIDDKSNYVDVSVNDNKDGEVIVSENYMEKYNLKEGDTITLSEQFDDKEYTFTIVGGYYYPAALCVFMDREQFNKEFDQDKDYFNGYFSNNKINDIDEMNIASVITMDDLTVVTDQLEDSMGMMFPIIGGFSLALYMLLMYLLAKLVVEKNSQSISMVKILGYTSKEAGMLYNIPTAIVVIVSLIICVPVSCIIMKWLFFIFMHEMNGWLTFYVAPWIYIAMPVMGIICYAIVHVILQRKVAKIKMSQALKDME